MEHHGTNTDRFRRRISSPRSRIPNPVIIRRRVGLSSHPPRPPTDPDVQNARIRFLGSRVRCARPEPVEEHRCGERVTLQETPEAGPVETGFRGAPAEPVPPPPRYFATEAGQGNQGSGGQEPGSPARVGQPARQDPRSQQGRGRRRQQACPDHVGGLESRATLRTSDDERLTTRNP